jgi:hypothetical protein
MKRWGMLAGAAVAAWVTAIPAAPVSAQAAAQDLTSVSVPRRVMANGAVLAAGTYTLHLTADSPGPVVGQTPSESRWVEFVQGGRVKGKEVATVLTAAEAKGVINGPPPAPGTSRTDVLKGNDYVRIWVNKGGTNYLVHLAVARPPQP